MKSFISHVLSNGEICKDYKHQLQLYKVHFPNKLFIIIITAYNI